MKLKKPKLFQNFNFEKATLDRPVFFCLFFVFLCSYAFSSPLYSPSWGFTVDLPESYEYSGGDGKDRFSFQNPEGALFDLIVYHGEAGKPAPYASTEALARDIQKKLNNSGDMDSFEYRQKKAYLLELIFSLPGSGNKSSDMSGWALCLELSSPKPGTGQNSGGTAQTGSVPRNSAQTGERPMLLAMAYGPAGKQELQALYFSALDSIAPEPADRLVPGPITEFTYPRETRVEVPVFGLGINTFIYREDAEAAQALVDREFSVFRRYANGPLWNEAWKRFYRAIYRDSYDRLADLAFKVERKLNVPARENRDFADQALQWVQSFEYERDILGSDFVNLVSAATEGRGDCDSRAMLWAVILKQANIPSAIMVSPHFRHAMGLADLPGAGAHFELEGQKLLVAETTAKVSVGLIREDLSEISEWIGIVLE